MSSPVIYSDTRGDVDCCIACYGSFSDGAKRTLPNLTPLYSWEDRGFTPDKITCDFCKKTAVPSQLNVAIALVHSGFSAEHIRKACSSFDWPVDMRNSNPMEGEQFCQRLVSAGFEQSAAEKIVGQKQEKVPQFLKDIVGLKQESNMVEKVRMREPAAYTNKSRIPMTRMRSSAHCDARAGMMVSAAYRGPARSRMLENSAFQKKQDHK